MATEKQIHEIYEKIEKNTPDSIFSRINTMNVGMGNTLRFLYRNDGKASAGEISEAINTSTARTAVLIKNLAKKGFVLKEKSSEDSRVTIVSLTELGKREILRMQHDMASCLSVLIDEIGEERINLFMDISNDIRNVLNKFDSKCELKEEVNDQNL